MVEKAKSKNSRKGRNAKEEKSEERKITKNGGLAHNF